ncbi:MAG: SDR family oxidoreductase [Armatimonadetes bacterium]|nr:SDR family oxidoreductase [Armatimonadota bacterium]
MRLEGKTALITGAASGIGRATALLFAREGATVVIADIDDTGGPETAEAIRQGGGESLFIHTDITASADVQVMAAQALEAFGRVDILMNNAAVWQGDGPILRLEEPAWDAVVDGTLKSAYLCSKHVLPHMIEAGGGSIINISSINGLVGMHLTAYSAAKGGVIALTRILASDYGSEGVRVNVICPGTIATERARRGYEKRPQIREAFARITQLGRVGDPEDIARCALYLASDESAFVTGAVFTVDGGATAGIKVDW